MPPAAPPAPALRDPARLAALHATGLLDTPPEPAFDRVTALAAHATGAPMAMLTLVDADRQFFKSAHGLPPHLAAAGETSLEHALCRHEVESGEPLVIDDVRVHPLTRDDATLAALAALGVAAYAGVPLRSGDGHVLGTLCVADRAPRVWRESDGWALARLAEVAATEIVVRRRLAERERGEAAAREREQRFRGLVEQASDAVFVLDARGTFQYVSPSTQRILGYEPAALTGTVAFDLVAPEHVAAAVAALGRALVEPGTTQHVQVRVRHADGSWRVMEAHGRAPDAGGDGADAVLVHLRDATARVAAEDALRESEERFRALSASSPLGIFRSDAAGGITYANARALALWEAAEPEILGDGWLARVHPADRAELVERWAASLASGRETELAYRLLLPDGTVRHVKVWAAPLCDAHGAVVGAVGTVVDVTERRHFERALAEGEERLRLALDAAQMVAWEIDLRPGAAGRDAATSAMALTGSSPIPFDTYAAFLDAVHPEDRERVAAAGARALAERSDFEEEFRVVLPDGDVRWRYGRGRLVFDAAGAPQRMVGVNLDVTARKAMEAELTRRAFHDALTGLANRALFRERVERALARVGEGRAPAVLFLDLDDFKTVNDSLGHEAGDRLLAVVAERLLNATRGCDTVARLGGDEFAILLGAVRHPGEAVTVAERVVSALGAPFMLDAREIRVGASVGIAVGCGACGVEDLLRDADVAMYRAKARGKGRHETFVPAMRAAVVDRLDLETDLRYAVERGELVVLYQPIVELDSGRLTGAEALLRWRHPARGLVLPDAFVPLAEVTGAIVPIGRWVLAEACREAARWTPPGGVRPEGREPLAVSVNVSGRQLDDPEFPADVDAVLRDTGLDPRRLVLEITEGTLMRDTDAALERLGALTRLGVRIAIDDFGTGFSSLAYLQQFPVDVLKIDKAFVDGIAAGGRHAALARTIVALGDALGLRTVAEGIEDAGQQAQLLALGCRHGQGYLYSPPIGADALRAVLFGDDRRDAA